MPRFDNSGMTATIQFDSPQSSVPHFDQPMGLWAIEDSALNSLVTVVSQMNLGKHLAAQGEMEGQGLTVLIRTASQ